jgi:hypothetical protein
LIFFCLLLFEGTFTSVFIDKKSKRSQNTVYYKIVLSYFFLLVDGSSRIRIQIQLRTKIMTDPDPDPGGPKHTDPIYRNK